MISLFEKLVGKQTKPENKCGDVDPFLYFTFDDDYPLDLDENALVFLSFDEQYLELLKINLQDKLQESYIEHFYIDTQRIVAINSSFMKIEEILEEIPFDLDRSIINYQKLIDYHWENNNWEGKNKEPIEESFEEVNA